MSGYVQQHPSGGYVEQTHHNFGTTLMDVAASTLGLYALNASGLPEKFLQPGDSKIMIAAKEAVIFQTVVEARRALARGGYSLPALYGGGSSAY